MKRPRDWTHLGRALALQAIVVLVALVVWLALRAQGETAVTWLVIAALGVVSFGVQYVFHRFLPEKTTRARVHLHVDGSTALRWATEAVRELGPEGELQVDTEQRSVSAFLPRTWKSWGEQVAAVVHEGGRSSTVEIWSKCIRPWITDFGKNEANVYAVKAALEFLDRATKG